MLKSNITDKVELLVAAAELHGAVGVPATVMEQLLEQCHQQIKDGQGEAEVSLPDFIRACGLCHWSAAGATERIFATFLERFPSPTAAAAIRGCRQLPAPLRMKLVETFLPQEAAEISAFFPPGSSKATAVAWLEVVQDLPALAAARDTAGRASN